MKPYLRWALDKVLPPRPKADPIIKFLSIRQDDIVAEIGANIGGNTIALARRARAVYAFEPNPFAFRLLKQNTSKFQNVVCFNVALGETFETRTLRLSSKNKLDPGASFVGISNHPRYSKEIETMVLPLDYFEIKATVLIIDCEGSEVSVLKGALNTLKAIRLLAIECHKLINGTNTAEAVKTFLSRSPQKELNEGFGNLWLTFLLEQEEKRQMMSLGGERVSSDLLSIGPTFQVLRTGMVMSDQK